MFQHTLDAHVWSGHHGTPCFSISGPPSVSGPGYIWGWTWYDTSTRSGIILTMPRFFQSSSSLSLSVLFLWMILCLRDRHEKSNIIWKDTSRCTNMCASTPVSCLNGQTQQVTEIHWKAYRRGWLLSLYQRGLCRTATPIKTRLWTCGQAFQLSCRAAYNV